MTIGAIISLIIGVLLFFGGAVYGLMKMRLDNKNKE